MFLALKNGLGRLAVFFRGLFDEYGGAAAAYSLRRLGSAYSGPLVRVRRASDNVEVNVAFDGGGIVSANSAITNVEDISLISESGFATDTGGFESSISGATFSFGNTLDGRSNVLFATFDGSGLLGLNFLTSDVAIGDVVVYSFDVYWPSTNGGELPDLRIRSGNTTIGHVDVPMPSKDSWYTFSGQFTVTGNTPAALTLIAANSSGLTTGDIFAIANGSYAKQQDAGDTTATTLGDFLTEGGNQDAYVHTWYDQSGNNHHATQDTAGNQPKIAEAGALLADGIDFDGVDDYIKTSTTLSLTQPLTGFSVSHTDITATSQGLWTLAANDTTSGEIVSFFRNDTGLAINAGATLTTAGSLSYSAGVNYLKTGIYNTTSSVLYINGTSHATGTVGTNNPSGLMYVGRMHVGASALYLDGGIKEIIVYNSDQTANRSDIEANIADEYGITLP